MHYCELIEWTNLDFSKMGKIAAHNGLHKYELTLIYEFLHVMNVVYHDN